MQATPLNRTTSATECEQPSNDEIQQHTGSAENKQSTPGMTTIHSDATHATITMSTMQRWPAGDTEVHVVEEAIRCAELKGDGAPTQGPGETPTATARPVGSNNSALAGSVSHRALASKPNAMGPNGYGLLAKLP